MKMASFLRRCANATIRSTFQIAKEKLTGQHVKLLAFLTTGRLSRENKKIVENNNERKCGEHPPAATGQQEGQT